MISITHHKTKLQANNDLDHCTLLFLTLNHMFKIRIAANNAANSVTITLKTKLLDKSTQCI
jgi:hypothetical protein